MKTPALLFALVLICGTSLSVNAHDYWIAPQNYQPQVGQSVAIKLFVGDHFSEDTERPLQQKLTVNFLLHNGVTASRNLIVANQFTKKTVAQFVINKPGTYVISMQRNWSEIEMTGDKFQQYLEHEGLQHIIAQRRKAGEADKSATERYRRYLKSLLVVGGKRTATWNVPLGHKLEIIPLSDPTVAKQNDTLPVRVLLDNNALANVQLAALGRQVDKVTDIHTTTGKTVLGVSNFRTQVNGWCDWSTYDVANKKMSKRIGKASGLGLHFGSVHNRNVRFDNCRSHDVTFTHDNLKNGVTCLVQRHC